MPDLEPRKVGLIVKSDVFCVLSIHMKTERSALSSASSAARRRGNRAPMFLTMLCLPSPVALATWSVTLLFGPGTGMIAARSSNRSHRKFARAVASSTTGQGMPSGTSSEDELIECSLPVCVSIGLQKFEPYRRSNIAGRMTAVTPLLRPRRCHTPPRSLTVGISWRTPATPSTIRFANPCARSRSAPPP
jgi:hypothetical protein